MYRLSSIVRRYRTNERQQFRPSTMWQVEYSLVRHISEIFALLEEVRNSDIGVGTFAPAQAYVGFKNHFARQKKGKASAETLMQVAEIQIPAFERHLPSIIKDQEPNWAPNPAVEFRLNQEGIWAAEAIVAKGAQRWLVVDITASNRFLKIERHSLRSTSIGHRDSEPRR